jgi:hypothetical protein
LYIMHKDVHWLYRARQMFLVASVE